MKNYMMIFIGADYGDLGLSPEEIQGRIGKWWAWSEKMEKAGVLRGGDALHATAKRITGAERIITDGPFVEGKELVGGYYTVAANNVDDVVNIAQDYPDYDIGGTLEIREVMVFEK